MNIQQIIESLKGENDLIVFDSGTGDIRIPEQLNETDRFFYDVHAEAAKALKKLVPKPVIYEGDGYADGVIVYDMAYCPSCDHAFEEGSDGWESKFCKDCGQALDWNSSEEMLQQKVDEWIPCNERLPEEKGEYLVTYHPCYWDDVSQEIKVGIDNFRGRSTWAKNKYQRIIAWKPLPKPYIPPEG